MEVEILSREFIKPSSPTPTHLKIHKLSSLDQTFQSHYIPIYSFYDHKNTCSPEERCQRLKSSLSQLLTLYYPFAGTFYDHSSVLCDDHGVPFTHAHANTTISSFLHNLDLNLLHNLAPDQVETKADVVKVQGTDFSCGGFVLCLLVSHLVSDGISISIFGRSWAILCRDQNYKSEVMTKLRPDFSAAIHFPPADHIPATAMMVPFMPPFLMQGKLRVRRIVFVPSAIEALKKKAVSQSVPRPSKGEVVSGLLSKNIISALEARFMSKCGANISHIVNLRQRAEPQFLITSTGNYLWPAMVVRAAGGENDLRDMVSEARKATSKIDGQFVERLRASGSGKVFEELERVHSGAPAAAGNKFIQITNTCNFRYYENDSGWGKPVWVCVIGAPPCECTVFMNLVVLTDTRTGDGVDALVFLDEQDMAFLEGSQELLAYAEFDQDPLLTNNTGGNGC